MVGVRFNSNPDLNPIGIQTMPRGRFARTLIAASRVRLKWQVLETGAIRTGLAVVPRVRVSPSD